MNVAYNRAREDFEFLESVAELTDQVELDADRLALMRNPTKAKAAEMYACGIRLWIAEHGDDYAGSDEFQRIAEEYAI